MLKGDTFFQKILKKTFKILSNTATQYVTDMLTVDTSTGTVELYSLYSSPSSVYTVDPPVWAPAYTPECNGSMGVQYLLWVINEQCLEFTEFSSRNIAVRAVSWLGLKAIPGGLLATFPGTIIVLLKDNSMTSL